MGELERPAERVAQAGARERFIELIGQGVSNSEACRIVGINRRTGTRWRFGRTIRNTNGEAVHYPPVIPRKASKRRSDRYLSVEERVTIADLKRGRVERSGDRGRAGQVSVDDQSRVAPQHRGHRPLPAPHRAATR